MAETTPEEKRLQSIVSFVCTVTGQSKAATAKRLADFSAEELNLLAIAEEKRNRKLVERVLTAQQMRVDLETVNLEIQSLLPR